MSWTIRKHEEYLKWIAGETRKSRAQIEKRLMAIQHHGHFGHSKDLGEGLVELKFNDGRRIYFGVTGNNEITLLLGGNKNGQDKDIKKARRLLDR